VFHLYITYVKIDLEMAVRAPLLYITYVKIDLEMALRAPLLYISYVKKGYFRISNLFHIPGNSIRAQMFPELMNEGG
jgi:hypothetical protein